MAVGAVGHWAADVIAVAPLLHQEGEGEQKLWLECGKRGGVHAATTSHFSKMPVFRTRTA